MFDEGSSVPPLADLAAERAVLGSVLLENDALGRVMALGLCAGDFQIPAHGLVFEGMVALAARQVPIDVITLAGELRGRDRLNAIGGAHYLGELTDQIPTTAHVVQHARILMDRARAARVMASLGTAMARLRNHEPLDGAVALELEQCLVTEQRRAPLVAIQGALDELVESWQRPEGVVSSGIQRLDGLLGGGIRPGDMIGVVGAAGGGKSAFVGQIALDAARNGATVVYASVEMPPAELVARWLALELFRTASNHGTDWPVGYRDVLYGRAWRGEGVRPEHREAVQSRLTVAGNQLSRVGDRLFVQQIEPGSTVDDLRARVTVARELSGLERPLLLVVDPLQRLFASERSGRRGRAADAVNSNETERVGTVAQELKFLADTESMAVLFTSDTTKAAAMGAQSSVGSMRGSYQINHLATLVLGVHTAQDAAALRTRLDGRGKDAEPVAPGLTEDAIRSSMIADMMTRPDAEKLGVCVAAMEVSKNRRGPVQSFVLTFVPGAMCFIERLRDSDFQDDDEGRDTSSVPPKPLRRTR
jgi:replicative DNA helicase